MQSEILHEYAVQVSAGVASSVTVLLGYPFDSLKTRMQVFKYPSVVDAVKHTYATEGVPGFYRGLFPVLSWTCFLRVSSFSLYSESKQYFKNPSHSPLLQVILPSFTSGALTGGIIATFAAPLEFIKVQRQLQKLTGSDFQGTSFYAWAKRIIQLKGPSGLYIGYRLHLLRELLGTGIYFSVYDTFKHLFINPQSPSHALQLAAGGFAGSFAWIVLFPFDLVKTIYQRDSLNPRPMYGSVLDIIRYRWSKGFIRGFYRGMTPQLIRSFPIHAVNFWVYEHMLAWCKSV